MIDIIKQRHSVRQYKRQPIDEKLITVLSSRISEINRDHNLHIQLICNEPKAFQGKLAKYGKFSGVENYLVMAGEKSDKLDEKIGYYGEELVLLAQSIGLNTCWVGLTYTRIPDTYVLNENEKIVCYISIGYGENNGIQHRIRSASDISNLTSDSPLWFKNGIDATLLAPSAVNQQKYYIKHLGDNLVQAKSRMSLIGYTKLDLGIAKLHFEIGAGKDNFLWEE